MDKPVIKKVPPWFSMEKYEPLGNHSAAAWAKELYARLCVRSWLHPADTRSTSAKEKELATEVWRVIKGYALVSAGPETPPPVRPRLLAARWYRPEYANVRPLSQEEAYAYVWDSRDPKAILAQMAALEQEVQGFLSRDVCASLSHPIDDLADPDFPRSHATIVVSLDAPEAIILAEFESWLRAERARLDLSEVKNRFKKEHYARWVSLRVLPYIDLRLHAAIEGPPLPYHVIASAIFPERVEIDIVEAVRKTTKPLADYLMRDDVINALEAQGESETRNG